MYRRTSLTSVAIFQCAVALYFFGIRNELLTPPFTAQLPVPHTLVVPWWLHDIRGGKKEHREEQKNSGWWRTMRTIIRAVSCR